MNRKIKIALSGNPNSGKSTAFNAITGARQHIANYPGVTVEKKVGFIHHRGFEIEVVDLPGTYSLTAYSLEEIVARNFLVNEKPDVVVDIVDASNLDRNLYLAVQFKELGAPLVIALNMIDVAESRGIGIDVETLSSLLGVPVVPTVARSNKGIEELLDRIVESAQDSPSWRPELISYGNDIDQALNEIEEALEHGFTGRGGLYSRRWLALKCLEGDDQIIQLIRESPQVSGTVEAIRKRVSKHTLDTLEEEPEGLIADYRYGYIAGITRRVVKRRIEARLNNSDRIDRFLTNRLLGPLVMIGILYSVYQFIFWAGGAPVEWIETFFDWLKGGVARIVPEGPLQSLMVSGVIDGVGGVLGFVPLIMFLFFAISIMEDSGYLARVAYMLDRVLRWFGLHGNSVIALLVSGGISGGCAVPGVMATRTLRDPKERLATLLVVPFMNCGAKLPVFALLIAAFFRRGEAEMMFLFTLLSWFFALFAAKLIRATILRGPKTPFVMELPPYRAPTLKGLLIHTWERTWQYIKKAGTVILGVSVLLWALMTYPGMPDERMRHYRDLKEEISSEFLSLPGAPRIMEGGPGLDAFDRAADRYLRAGAGDDQETLADLRQGPFSEALRAVFEGGLEDDYLLYRERLSAVARAERKEALLSTAAGTIGRALERITAPLGFDYKINIALVGGFAAKEVIVSTLGTAYSLGEEVRGREGSLSERLSRDPEWNRLRAFTLLVFTMLYVPCFVTVLSIRRESSWRWAGFSVVFNLTAAYLVALIAYQGGLLLGLGGG